MVAWVVALPINRLIDDLSSAASVGGHASDWSLAIYFHTMGWSLAGLFGTLVHQVRGSGKVNPGKVGQLLAIDQASDWSLAIYFISK